MLKTKKELILISFLLTIATAAAYWRLYNCDFIYYDDPKYVTENTQVKAGVTFDGIIWAFTKVYANNWHPLTWISLMVDQQIWGTNVWGFHLVNLLFHIANTILLFFLLYHSTGRMFSGALVAGFFALHPLHTESVAWISERKDVLSTFFWLVTMFLYLWYTRKISVSRYILVIVLFCLGLMAKSMLVSLPMILMLWDYWPLKRFAFDTQNGDIENRQKRKASFLIIEKIPFFILTALSCVMTLIAQKEAIAAFEVFPLNSRLSNALISYVIYMLQMFWPTNLAVFYPHPVKISSFWQWGGALILLLVITAAVIFLGRRRKYLITGWFWYIVTLVPVIGFVQVGEQARADRYTYITLIGLFVLIIYSFSDLANDRKIFRFGAAFAGISLCLFMGFLTSKQTSYWKNSEILYRHALDVTRDNDVAHNNLGIFLAEKNDIAGAIEQFDMALKLNPNHPQANYNILKALLLQNKLDQALDIYERLKQSGHAGPDIINLLATEYKKNSQLQKVVEIYTEALKTNSNNASLHTSLGTILLESGRVDEAIEEFNKALKIQPDAITYGNLGNALLSKNKFEDAMECFKKGIELEPFDCLSYYNMGNIYMSKGQLQEAVVAYSKAVKIRKDYTKAYSNMAVAFAQMGKVDEAIMNFKKALQIDPNDINSMYNLAQTLAGKGEFDEAVKYFRMVITFEPNNAQVHDMIGDILIRQGKKVQAQEEFQQALKLEPNNPDIRKKLNSFLNPPQTNTRLRLNGACGL